MIDLNSTSRSNRLLWLRIVFIKLLRRLLNRMGGMLLTIGFFLKGGGVDMEIEVSSRIDATPTSQ